MTEEKKATFGATKGKIAEDKLPKEGDELAVAWKRVDKNGDEYISVKYKKEKFKEANFKMFKNKRKREGDSKPDYIAFKHTQKRTEQEEDK